MPTARLNGHDMYFEIHGPADGPPLVCMGGWGTWCHGGEAALPRGLTNHYRVVLFDYRGIGESTDDLSVAPSMKVHAADVAALLDHLRLERVHVVGMVGMGACVGQELAIARPDLVRSLVNAGAWAHTDPYFRDQMHGLRVLHRDVSFWLFQKETVLLSFDRDFYNANQHRLLGPQGGWSELRGRYVTHSRLTDCVITHHALDRLHLVKAPTLVIHAGRDLITPPALSLPIEQAIPGAEGVMIEAAAHVFAGRAMKKTFSDLLNGFLARH